MDKLKAWCKKRMTKDNMIVIALLGVLLMVISLPVEKNDSQMTESGLTDSHDVTMSASDNFETLYSENGLEQRLEELLHCMDGVGEVKVMVVFSASQENVVEKDIPVTSSQTSENDASGGSRNIIQQDVRESTIYTTDSGGNQVPYVKQTLAASVEGVTVVAQGGGSAVIQKEITDVIEALFGIEPHKIKVAKMGSTAAEGGSRMKIE